MKGAILFALALVMGCEAQAYTDCEEGAELLACAKNGEETRYCIEYMAPRSSACRIVAEIGEESFWCCPRDD